MSSRNHGVLLVLVALVFSTFSAIRLSAQSSTAAFSFPDLGGVSLTSSGASTTLSTGYSEIHSSGAAPAGFAIFGLHQDNALVSEATVPAATLVSEGRIYAEVGGGVDTGIAIANPNAQPVQIAFYLTDTAGVLSKSNVFTLPAGGQMAQFLDGSLFNAPANFQGTFTFFVLESQPTMSVGAIALRGFTNERGEFLMTTLPVTPVGVRGLFSGDVLPHFASGAGWATQVILINPTDGEEDGTISFSGQSGQATTVNSVSGTSASAFNYHIAAGSSFKLQTTNTGTLSTGSVRLASTGITADIPVGFLIFSYQSNGITVSSAGVAPTRSTAATRLFVETSGNFSASQVGSLQTGIAISNADSSAPVQVTYTLTSLNGAPTGLQGSLTIPAGGQTAQFLGQLPGMQSLPASFQGVLRIAAASGSVTITGLRGRYNERGDFLVTTVPSVNENDPYFNLNLQYSNFIFPHFADGGGYTTQFVLFSGWTTGQTSGTLQFLSNTGVALPLTLLNQ